MSDQFWKELGMGSGGKKQSEPDAAFWKSVGAAKPPAGKPAPLPRMADPGYRSPVPGIAPATTAMVGARAGATRPLFAGVGGRVQGVTPQANVASAIFDIIRGRANPATLRAGITSAPEAILGEQKRSLHEMTRPAAEASAALGPKAGLFGPAASAIESSPVMQHKIAAETIRNLDPTQIPAFVHALTADDPTPMVKEMTTGLVERIAKGDEQAVVQLMGMVNATALGAAFEGVGGIGGLRGKAPKIVNPAKTLNPLKATGILDKVREMAGIEAPRDIPIVERSMTTYAGRKGPASAPRKLTGTAAQMEARNVQIVGLPGTDAPGYRFRDTAGPKRPVISDDTLRLGAAAKEAGLSEPQAIGAQVGAANTFRKGREAGKPVGDIRTADKPKGGAMRQEQAAAFFSKLQRVAEEKLPNRATPEQIRKTLEGAGVKPEEMEWTGTNRFLAEHEGPVTKQALLDHILENRVQVEETVLGGDTPNTIEPFVKTIQDAGYGVSVFGDNSFSIYDSNRGSIPLDKLRDHGVPDAVVAAVGDLDAALQQRGLPTETKFGSYTTPGGKNYRELLLRLPEGRAAEYGVFNIRTGQMEKGPGTFKTKGAGEQWLFNEVGGNARAEYTVKPIRGQEDFRQGHFDEPNVLAHVRFDERAGPNGERILHIAEIQSDWHQKGRSGGYASDVRVPDFKAQAAQDASRYVVSGGPRLFEIRHLDNPAFRLTKQSFDAAQEWIRDYATQRAEALENDFRARTSTVPDAPFKKTWHELAMKRMIRWAAENGFDEITWDTGATQADRYDLSKRVSKVQYLSQGEGVAKGELWAFDLDGRKVIDQRIDDAELPDYVGKEAAERLMASEPRNGVRELSGLDLKVGGEGMKGFYDKILPDFANKYTKKWGGKVEAGEISKGDSPPFESKALERLAEGDDELYGPPPGWKPSEQFADWPLEEAWQQEVIESASRIQGQLIEGDIGGRKPNLLEAIDAENNYGNPQIADAIRNWLELKGDLEPRSNPAPAHRLVLTPEMKASVLNEGQPLFQRSTPGIKGTYDPRTRTIEFIKGKADFSTIVHEVAHYFHDWLKDDAKYGKLITDTYGDLTDVKGAEQFARHYEQYLRSGKAPNPGLKNVFAAIAQWMKDIYQTWRHGKPSKEVRAIFDEIVGEQTPEVQELVRRFDEATGSKSEVPPREAGAAQEGPRGAHASAEPPEGPAGVPDTPKPKPAGSVTDEPTKGRQILWRGKQYSFASKADEDLYDQIHSDYKTRVNPLTKRAAGETNPETKLQLLEEANALARGIVERKDELFEQMGKRLAGEDRASRMEAGIEPDLDAEFARRVSDDSGKLYQEGELNSPSHLKSSPAEKGVRRGPFSWIRATAFQEGEAAERATAALGKETGQKLGLTKFDLRSGINRLTRLDKGIEDTVFHGFTDDNGKRITIGVRGLMEGLDKDGIPVDLWQDYRRALREIEVAPRMGAPASRVEANMGFVRAFLDKYGDKVGKWDAEWQKIHEANLDQYVKYGMRTAEDVANLKADNAFYFSLAQNPTKQQVTMRALNPQPGMASPDAGFVRAKGGATYGDGFAAMASNIENTIRTGEATKSFLPFLDEASKHENLQHIAREITPAEAEPAVAGAADIDDLGDVFGPDRPPVEGQDSVITVWDNGKKRTFVVDPYVWKAIQGTQPSEFNAVQKIFRAAADLSRAGTTGRLNPFFRFLFNPMIDMASATLVHGMNPLRFLQGAAHSALAKAGKQTGFYKGAIKNNVMFGGGIRDFKEAQRMFSPTDKGALKRNWLKKGIQVYDSIGEVFEEATRLGYYAQQLRSGQRLARKGKVAPSDVGGRASQLSADLFNFGESSTFGRSASAWGVPYSNIVSQAMTSAARGFKRNPAGFIARGTALMTVPAVWEYMTYKDDPEWQGFEDYIKTGALTFRDGVFRGKPHEGKWLAIRIPNELGVIFRGIPIRAMQEMDRGDKADWSGAAKEQMNSMADAWTPSFIPTFLAALGQAAFYQDSGGTPDMRFMRFRSFPVKEDAKPAAKDKARYQFIKQEVDTLLGSMGRYGVGLIGYELSKDKPENEKLEKRPPSMLQRYRPMPSTAIKQDDGKSPKKGGTSTATILKRFAGAKRP